VLLALEHRRETGHGMTVEAPMVIGALNMTAEQVIEYSAYGTLLQRRGNHGVKAVPHDLYLSADRDPAGDRDTFVAIEVETDDQWRRLVGALGAPAWAADASYATLAGREAAEDAIDAELAAWCAARSSAEIVDALWPTGVPVGIVKMPHDVTDLAPFRERGFFEPLDHPLIGTALYTGLPIRFSAGPARVHRRHAPFLGEHNAEVLHELGLDDDAIADLGREGIIGAEPLVP
jgi:crotonobetainyl-CoA:carnitine CoA-transferase CaiB-like acyl-CoA transferase